MFKSCIEMDVELSSIWVANYWSVRLFSRRIEDKVKEGSIFILAGYNSIVCVKLKNTKTQILKYIFNIFITQHHFPHFQFI